LRLVGAIRQMVISIAAQVYWRFEVNFGSYPYPLLRLCDRSASYDDRLAVAKAFFEASPCCLDPHFSRKVRLLFPSAEAMIADDEFVECLRAWAYHSKICNMHVERIFAQIRKAVPGTNPHAERICSAGLLTQVRHRHEEAGGRDVSAVRRQDLVDHGVPVASNVEA
jgi:hypothetical protein